MGTDLSLNQTWKNCRRMWKWITKICEPGGDVEELKIQWLEKHKPGLYMINDCFFCDYAGPDEYGNPNCSNCPGVLVNRRFDCSRRTYHYYDKPKKFYQKLLDLDTERKSNG